MNRKGRSAAIASAAAGSRSAWQKSDAGRLLDELCGKPRQRAALRE